VASELESAALEGIFDFLGGFLGNVGLFGFPAPDFRPSTFRFPSVGSSIRVVPSTGGITEEPVLAPPVFEPPRGGEPGTSSPLEPSVSLFDDIVGVGRDVISVFSGGGGDASGGFGVLGDIFRRRTTSAEERVLSGTFFEGDIATAIGNIGGEIAAGQAILGTFDLAGNLVDRFTGGGASMATDIAPCPVPGGSAGFPAGACITIGDWQKLGAPRGFEVAGISQGQTLILRKKRRRRRRGGLTKGMMTDVDYLARKLGKPAAETYLNRVL